MSAARERLHRPALHAADRAGVPWHDVDLDADGRPLHPDEPTDGDGVTYWTAPDGTRVWVFGDN